MITDWFITWWNSLVDGLPAVPAPPAWWPATAFTIPTEGVVSAVVLNGAFVTWALLLGLVPTVKVARRVLSLMTAGGGAL